jgi:predicted dehydrogenase
LPRLLLPAAAPDLRAVVAEKPLAPSVAQARAIVEAFEAAGIPLLVNFSRRYTDLYQGLRRRFMETGPALSATIRYAKGVRHNGGHALDLIRFLFGPPEHWQALAARHDAWPDDPTVSAFLRCPRCPEVFLIGLDERRFTHFEVDIIDADGRFQIDRDHRRLRRSAVADDTGQPPGRRLVEVECADSGYDQAMTNLMAHVSDVIENRRPPLCSGREALATLGLAEALVGGAADAEPPR